MSRRRPSHRLTLATALIGATLLIGATAKPAHAWPWTPAPWAPYFDEGPSLPAVEHGWSSYLKFNHENCDRYAMPMDTLVRDYDIAAYHGDAKKADELYGKIHDILFVQLGEKNPCFKGAAFTYALNSLFWVDNIDFPYERIAGDQRSADTYLPRQKTFLLAALMNRGNAALLTPLARGKMGGVWSKLTQRGTPEVLGTFDCGTSTISFDILQRPLDEASTLVHELDHFVRDKVLSDEYSGVLQNSFNTALARKALKTLRPRDILLLDETLSTAYAALLQLRYRLSPAFVELESDLSFSSSFGPISKIWKAIEACGRMGSPPFSISDYGIRETLDAFVDQYSGRGCISQADSKRMVEFDMEKPRDRFELAEISSYYRHDSKEKGVIESVREIYRVVLAAYFSGIQPLSTTAIMADLDPSRLGGNWAALASWENHPRVMLAFTDTALRLSPEDAADRIEELLKLTNSPSSSCKDYYKAFQSGALDGYLDGLERGSEKGVKGATLVHPEKGVKGQDGMLRLCVDFERKL